MKSINNNGHEDNSKGLELLTQVVSILIGEVFRFQIADEAAGVVRR